VASVNSILTALSKGDNVRDYQHGARMFVDNNYELQPRYANLFHVVFNLTAQAAKYFNGVEKIEINMLVKSIDLPSFNIDTQTHNQYNREVHSQHKIHYNPINVTFHDDQKDLIRSFLYTYTNFYYDDSKYALGGGSYSTNDRYGGRKDNQWGLVKGNVRFFKDIRVYSMLQKRFAEYILINPMITNFGHDAHAYTNTGLMQHSMQIQYETVKYATGFVNNVNPKGFADIHYDKTPSPIGIFGRGPSNSIFFGGGLIDAANVVASDLASGNIIGAIVKGGLIFNNTKDISLKDVFSSDLKRATNKILRGQNPLADISIPNIFKGGRQPSPGATSGAVDRSAIPKNPGRITSNGRDVFNGGFFGSQPRDFNKGNTWIDPDKSSSAAARSKISDFSNNNQKSSPLFNTKYRKRQEITSRIADLTTQGGNDKEIYDLKFELQQKFGKPWRDPDTGQVK
jgi:hypothetical protein